MKNVAIVDLDVGNLFSVKQAFLSLGTNAFFTRSHDEIMKADFVVLPGVGAFARSMENMKKWELDKSLLEYSASKKPLMGVCLGLQLLFESSEEFGDSEGLGLLKGKVKKLPSLNSMGEKILIPQIAWNNAIPVSIDSWKQSPMKSATAETYFYFVHSFFVDPSENIILSTTNYSNFSYCSSIMKNNIFAVQFHPEKSGESGIEIYKNWINN